MIPTPGLLGWLYFAALVGTGIAECLSVVRYRELIEVGDSPWYIVSAGPVAAAIWYLGSAPAHRALSVALCLYLIRFQFNTARKWQDRAFDSKRRHPKYHSPRVKCILIWLFHDAAGLLTALFLAKEV